MNKVNGRNEKNYDAKEALNSIGILLAFPIVLIIFAIPLWIISLIFL